MKYINTITKTLVDINPADYDNISCVASPVIEIKEGDETIGYYIRETYLAQRVACEVNCLMSGMREPDPFIDPYLDSDIIRWSLMPEHLRSTMNEYKDWLKTHDKDAEIKKLRKKVEEADGEQTETEEEKV